MRGNAINPWRFSVIWRLGRNGQVTRLPKGEKNLITKINDCKTRGDHLFSTLDIECVTHHYFVKGNSWVFMIFLKNKWTKYCILPWIQIYNKILIPIFSENVESEFVILMEHILLRRYTLKIKSKSKVHFIVN